MRGQKMRFQLTAVGLACATLLSACGGGSGGGEGEGATGNRAQSVDFAFPGERRLLTPPAPLLATASTGLPVTFKSNTPDICAIDGVNLVVLKPGGCSVTATQAGDSTYMPASARQVFNVLKHTQFVSFPSPGFQSITETPAPLLATSESGGPVSFASTTPLVCTASGTTLTLVSKGSCTIAASQAGNDNYAPGTASVTFVVGDDKPEVLTVMSGIKSVSESIEGGAIVPWAGSNLVNGWSGCTDPDWCTASFNAADGSFTWKYVLQPNDPKYPKNNDGYIGGYFGFDLRIPGVNLNGSGNTTEGLRVSNQATMRITVAQNAEAIKAGNGKIAVALVLGHFNNNCNVAPMALLPMFTTELTTFEVPLSEFKAFDKSCDLKDLNLATELANHPIVMLKVFAPNLNTTEAGASPTSPGYPNTITIKGPVTFQ